jgi:hypothetical protein
MNHKDVTRRDRNLRPVEDVPSLSRLDDGDLQEVVLVEGGRFLALDAPEAKGELGVGEVGLLSTLFAQTASYENRVLVFANEVKVLYSRVAILRV